MSKVLTTTVDSENAARTMFSQEWDSEGTTSVHLPLVIAGQLLEARGWEPMPNSPIGWLSPSQTIYWETSEALAVALSAEVI